MVRVSGDFQSDAQRWAAIEARAKDADGAFFYSVKTTGVYCRPSCASRPAKPGNVAFHESCEAAERAGFRPCKRCKPNEAPDRYTGLVAKACRRIQESEALPTLAELAAAAGMSRFHFHRVFKEVTGITPRAWGAAYRAQKVREELARSRTVTEAIYGAGFNSGGRFYAASDGILGMKPSDYRSGGSGAKIRFAVGECSLGALLVAATDRGVCAILLGDDAEELTRDLQDRFPRATLVGGDGSFEHLVARVVALVEAPRLGLDLPLDIRGTAFQQRVWQALCSVPAGETVSYAQIAERIGAPRAVRAVAQACGANSLAVAIPCHRVVRRDGAISGYRWGVERKQALLDREKRA